MFGLLKNKLTSFIKSVTGREEKAAPPAEAKIAEPIVFQIQPETKPEPAVQAREEGQKPILGAAPVQVQAPEVKIEPVPERKAEEAKPTQVPEIKPEPVLQKPEEPKLAPELLLEAKPEPKPEPKPEIKQEPIIWTPAWQPAPETRGKPSDSKPEIKHTPSLHKPVEQPKSEALIEKPVAQQPIFASEAPPWVKVEIKPEPVTVVAQKEPTKPAMKAEPVLEEKPGPATEKPQEQPKSGIKPEPKEAPVLQKPSEPPAQKQPEQKKSFLSSILSPILGHEEKKPVQAKELGAKPQEKPKPEIVPDSEKPALKKPELPPQAKPEEKAGQTAPQKLPEKAGQSVPQKPSGKIEQPLPPNPAISQSEARSMSDLERRASSDRRETAPKIGLGTAIKSFFTNEITIDESEVSDLLSELELSLLEADVSYEVSLAVTDQLRLKLVGMKVPKGEVESRTKKTIQDVLEAIMDSDRKFSLPARARELPKPVKILFVGPNGAGKTTTMAKVARLLMDSGQTVVFSASDTFRAAAIEQAEVHAQRLGVNVVKSGYGADPSSVAFDAINFARSHGIDVVLIDSAGRQDTNINLLDELKKMNRVAKPDIKIYIGESIGGHSIIEQISAFDEAIGIDGAILTKLDCDAKGGTAISVSRATGIPVLYLGVGQAYTDLVVFDPHKIAQEIMN